MYLKIFSAGNLKEEEFNKFISENIVEKINFLNDGSAYILYRTFDQIGSGIMKKIELLDEIIRQNEGIIFTTGIELAQNKANKEEIEKNIESLKKNRETANPYGQKGIDKDIKKWEEDLSKNELQAKASMDTINQKEIHNKVCKGFLAELIEQNAIQK